MIKFKLLEKVCVGFQFHTMQLHSNVIQFNRSKMGEPLEPNYINNPNLSIPIIAITFNLASNVATVFLLSESFLWNSCICCVIPSLSCVMALRVSLDFSRSWASARDRASDLRSSSLTSVSRLDRAVSFSR